MNPLKFSIIIPVLNRPKEVHELLESLSKQTYQRFEVIIVEDGSDENKKVEVQEFKPFLELQYFYKQNTGPGDSRNFGASKATGDYLIFFDSDCLIPENYLDLVAAHLSNHWLDVYGGPDSAHDDFTNLQKAIDYAMTSFLTTGGIRGHKRTAATFQPRSFNMGVSMKAWLTSGGFSNIHPGEDPDLVYRLMAKGHTKGLIPNATVYHKRRLDFKKFGNQVYKFGIARSILMKWHHESKKWVFALPSLGLLMGICFFFLGFEIRVFWYVLILGLLIVLFDSLRRTRNIAAGFLGLIATTIQISCYGWGFLKGFWYLFVLKREERTEFTDMFMDAAPEIP